MYGIDQEEVFSIKLVIKKFEASTQKITFLEKIKMLVCFVSYWMYFNAL